MFPLQVVDPDLYRQSLQLFRQDRNVDKKAASSLAIAAEDVPA